MNIPDWLRDRVGQALRALPRIRLGEFERGRQVIDRAGMSMTYAGPGTDDGSIDVRHLAPGMLAMSDLLQTIARELNGPDQSVTMRLSLARRSNSYEAVFDLIRNHADVAGGTLLAAAFTIRELRLMLFGKDGSLAAWSIEWFRELKAAPPDRPPQLPKRVWLRIGDDGQVEVDPRLFLRPLSELLQPMAGEDIETLTLRDEHAHEIGELSHEHYEATRAALDVIEPPEIRHDELVVEIVQPVFEGDYQWRVRVGPIRVQARMLDERFISDVRTGAVTFRHGDLYRVRLRTLEPKSGQVGRARYEIVKVFGLHAAGTGPQQNLELADDDFDDERSAE